MSLLFKEPASQKTLRLINDFRKCIKFQKTKINGINNDKYLPITAVVVKMII